MAEITRQATNGHVTPSLLIWIVILGAITPIITAVASYIKSRETRDQTKQALRETKAIAGSVEVIKHATNDDRDRMIKKMETLEARNVVLEAENKALEEYRRTTEEIPTHIRLALLDDDKRFSQLVRDALAREKGVTFEVNSFESSDAALEPFMEQKHDVYVVDLSLGGSSGMDFIRSLRDRGHPGPFVILSGHVDSASEAAALRSGVEDILEKGIEFHRTLGRRIRLVIQRFRSQRKQR